jgi:hypothetical protein
MSLDFNLGSLIIQTLHFDSENEMRARIKEFGRGILIEDEETRGQNILLKAYPPDAEWTSYCGIAFGGGINPQIAYHPVDFHCWIALDWYLFLVSFLEPKCIAKIKLPWAFWSLILLDRGSVVAVHELGAMCFDAKAQQLWEISGHDKLADYHIEGNNILCIFDDGQTVSHSLEAKSTT